jgi:hypothetical protein
VDAAALLITHLEFRRAGQSGVARIAFVAHEHPRRELSEIENPEPAALVLAFRDEAGREVRPAEFSDLQGLIQGLNTGVPAELEKLINGLMIPGPQVRCCSWHRGCRSWPSQARPRTALLDRITLNNEGRSEERAPSRLALRG